MPKPFKLPNLLELQRVGFFNLLESGLRTELELLSPIETRNGDCKLIFQPEQIKFENPQRTLKQCIRKRQSYYTTVYVPVTIEFRGTYQLKIFQKYFSQLIQNQGFTKSLTDPEDKSANALNFVSKLKRSIQDTSVQVPNPKSSLVVKSTSTSFRKPLMNASALTTVISPKSIISAPMSKVPVKTLPKFSPDIRGTLGMNNAIKKVQTYRSTQTNQQLNSNRSVSNKVIKQIVKKLGLQIVQNTIILEKNNKITNKRANKLAKKYGLNVIKFSTYKKISKSYLLKQKKPANKLAKKSKLNFIKSLSSKKIAKSYLLKKLFNEMNQAIEYRALYNRSQANRKITITSSPELVTVGFRLRLGQLPLLTSTGHYIINGSPRVIVNQIVRGPGVYFKKHETEKGDIFTASIVSEYGSWMRFELDDKDYMYCQIGKFKKYPVELLLQVLGFTKNQIFKYLKHGEIFESSLKEFDLSMPQAFKAFDELISESAVPDWTPPFVTQENGFDSPIQECREFLEDNFFNTKYYSLGTVGRNRLNEKLDLPDKELKTHLLRPEDILATINYLTNLKFSKWGDLDDVDNLKFQRARTSGELIQAQFRLGCLKFAQLILSEKLHPSRKSHKSIFEGPFFDPYIIHAGHGTNFLKTLRSFFGTSPLSQFMDQTNPLAEVTHKRRISSLGPGGLKSDQVSTLAREIHPSHYGRICPIETPEGKNAGLVNSLTIYARVTAGGFLITPFYEVIGDQVQKDSTPIFLSAGQEENNTIGVGDLLLKKNSFDKKEVPNRYQHEFQNGLSRNIDFVNLSALQILSIATALIPFLEHDDATRALMASNMQRQSVPLLHVTSPIVGTGLEAKVAYDSGRVLIAKESGYISSITKKTLEITSYRHLRTSDFDPKKTLYQLRIGTDQVSQVKWLDACLPTLMLLKTILDFSSNSIYSSKLWTFITNNCYDTVDVRRELLRKTHLPNTYRDNQPNGEANTDKYQSQGAYRQQYKINRYQRTNQDTCFDSKFLPNLKVNDFIEKGDLLTETNSTKNGEVSLGTNLLIAYMTWHGYNFEDSILISERLVSEGILTHIHIEKHDIEPLTTLIGDDIIVDIIEDGTWLTGGERLVWRYSPRSFQELSPYQALLQAIFTYDRNSKSRLSDTKTLLFHDTSIYIPDNTKARVIGVYQKYCDGSHSKSVYDLKRQIQFNHLQEKTKHFYLDEKTIKNFRNMNPISFARIYIARLKKIEIGDKVSGRHGNKGIISRILPRQDMPFLQDGTPVDMVLSPLGVPSRMNVGQLLESLLGLAGKTLGENYRLLPFDEMYGEQTSRSFVYKKLYEARKKTNFPWLFEPEFPGKSYIFDGQTGETYDQPIFVGYSYMIKLIHIVEKKIHSRCTGPYALVTQQPLKGRRQQGGQRLGEMEIWAFGGFGAAYILQEILTIKSDDIAGRNSAYKALVEGVAIPGSEQPAAFNLLISELKALCFHISINEDINREQLMVYSSSFETKPQNSLVESLKSMGDEKYKNSKNIDLPRLGPELESERTF